MLWLVGLGLADERDITVKGLDVVRNCKRVYLEAYTSTLLVPTERLEEFYGRSLIVADRDLVESGADQILEGAETDDVALLVVGDPFGATTHADLVLRARERGIPVRTVHNASIMNAIGACGLQLYTFGQTVSIVFFTETWRPDSFYDKIAANRKLGLHTLCLLDIKMKEQTVENMMRKRKIYEPPRFMTINQCIDQLLAIEEKRKDGGPSRSLARLAAYSANTLCVGLARVGADDQKIVVGTMAELRELDFGPPLHSFIIAGHVHELERDLLKFYAVSPASIQEHAELQAS